MTNTNYGVARVPGTEGNLNKGNVMEILTHTIICGKEFDVYGTADDPLFLAKDVAEIIEYSDGNVSEMTKMVDEDEKLLIFCKIGTPSKVTSHSLSASYNGSNRWFLTEDGLYEVLMQSNKPVAKQFKKGVKKLLKDIRLERRAPRTYREALVMALEAEDRRIAAEQMALEADKRRIEAEQMSAQLKEKIVEFAPKVDNYEQFLAIDDSITVSCVAKKFGMSAIKLNRILKNEGVQYKPKGRDFWLPKQGYEDWFMVKDVPYEYVGGKRLTNQARVTPLGEDKIKEILVRLGYHEQMLLPC